MVDLTKKPATFSKIFLVDCRSTKWKIFSNLIRWAPLNDYKRLFFYFQRRFPQLRKEPTHSHRDSRSTRNAPGIIGFNGKFFSCNCNSTILLIRPFRFSDKRITEKTRNEKSHGSSAEADFLFQRHLRTNIGGMSSVFLSNVFLCLHTCSYLGLTFYWFYLFYRLLIFSFLANQKQISWLG